MAPPAATPEPPVRAAQYLRMSTESQRYSLENQAAAIAMYAAARGIEIVRSYRDAGISGVSIARRRGLQALLADVLAATPDFTVILVYDVSRWGRFQNPDQSAHYEFLCEEAGVRVEYCAELFENDGSLASTLLKSVKRAMAADYSRELSVKVAAGRRTLSSKGYFLGAHAGYGLRRQMIDAHGRGGLILEYGQAKALTGCHNILIPGPAEEIAVVRRIYRLYVHQRLGQRAIAGILNREGIKAEHGGVWTYMIVHQILTSPKYVGDLVANRFRRRFGEKAQRNDTATWVRVPNAFEGIVPRQLFNAAQRRYAERPPRRSRQSVLAAAAEILAAHGDLSNDLVAASPGVLSRGTIRHHFGGLAGLCAELGHPYGGPTRRRQVRISSEEAIRRLAVLYWASGYLSNDLIDKAPDLPCSDHYRRRFGSLGAAYALVGFVPPSRSLMSSRVGVARIAAARARAERLWAGFLPQSNPPSAAGTSDSAKS